MHKIAFSSLFFITLFAAAQVPVNTSGFNKNGEVTIEVKNNTLLVNWPVEKGERGQILFDLEKDKPLFKRIDLSDKAALKTIAENIDPAFILTIGKRDLVSQNGWNIFFDKVPLKPHQSYVVKLDKRDATVSSAGSQTIIRISKMQSATFTGALEITLYNGSPLFNVAAVMATEVDSTAIIYDAGMVSKQQAWDNISWSDTNGQMRSATALQDDTAKNLEVKYRTVVGTNKQGSMAVFPAPHQYFYPLDECFNLKFTWYGNNYRNMISGFGIGIRQDLYGDNRYVPWFNAPPNTQQRLNFFCLLSASQANVALDEVKKFTHNDTYSSLPGYKTMSSHFHNEFIMQVVMAGKPVPEHPKFVDVFKATGVDIVHLAEFHYTAHPKGPDEQRLKELNALFEQCKRLSDDKFLLLPGEEPNEFFGGHWLAFFPKPVYWIMSRKTDMPFVTDDTKYGKVYRVADKTDMLKLLEKENGLAWTAHARTKGSTGFPDAYKEETFFKSKHFMGAAWKALPADLSQPRLGKRALDLLDDMNNWGLQKHMIGEADLFSIEPENELYAHLNVNYLQLDKLPAFKDGWQPILEVVQNGKFFTTTGEILMPVFTVNGKGTDEIAKIDAAGNAKVMVEISWTFPLNFAEIISGDGKQVYRERINLNDTKAFGKKQFIFNTNLKNKTWVRLEVWDIAANGAFTQTVWLR